MEDQKHIIENIKEIEDRIIKACGKSGRHPDEVLLLLATKTVPADRIAVALEAGHRVIAENKVQELKEKYCGLQSIAHINHFIGHLQSNKIKDLLRYDVTCIQSIDRFELAEKLNQRLDFEKKSMDIFIQVNTSNEESKFGVHPDQTLELIKQVAVLRNVRIKGLMTIGLLSNESDKVRACFQLLKNIQKRIIDANIPNVSLRELSMGMSGDLEIAIEEGATIIRVGTAIFGQRPTPDNYYWDESPALSTEMP